MVEQKMQQIFYINDVVKGFYASLMPLDIPIDGWMKTALSKPKSKKKLWWITKIIFTEIRQLSQIHHLCMRTIILRLEGIFFVAHLWRLFTESFNLCM